MFERWTERARTVMTLAQEEARLLAHNYIGTEHVLLGLLEEGEGMAARVLNDLDVSVDEVREKVARIVGIRIEGTEVAERIPMTPRVKKVLELALREALSLGHNYVGTEHILLGLVRENEGVGARILLDLDVTAEKVRNDVIRLLSGPRAPSPSIHRVRGVALHDVFRKGERVYKVLGIATDPTVTLEDVGSGELIHVVIGSYQFGEFEHLTSKDTAR